MTYGELYEEQVVLASFWVRSRSRVLGHLGVTMILPYIAKNVFFKVFTSTFMCNMSNITFIYMLAILLSSNPTSFAK
jgi:hypothetical protein